MKMVAVEHALNVERMAAEEKDLVLKSSFKTQAAAYRELATAWKAAVNRADLRSTEFGCSDLSCFRQRFESRIA
jgi:hypothetical protein